MEAVSRLIGKVRNRVADGHDDGWVSGLGSPADKKFTDLNPNLITQ